MTEDIAKAKRVACLKCGWISFAVSQAFADEQNKKWREFWDQMKPEDREKFYDNEYSEHSYTCMVCGGTSFRLATEEELAKIYGCTISPVVWEEL